MAVKMNSCVSWMFITVMVTTAKGKSKDKPKNEYAFSKESQFSSPDVFWPIHASLHGNGAPASSITALLHSAAVGEGEGNLGAAELTGTPDSYIQIPNTGDLDGKEAFCWIFNLFPTSSQTATILEYAGVGGTGNGVKLTQDGTKLVATVYDVTGTYSDSYERNILTINAWNFVGFSYNKVWGIIDIFKDDVEDPGKYTAWTDVEVNAVGDVTIGRSVDGTDNFQGKMSCIQFYKKALFNKALKNPPTYCDLSIWDASVLDWSKDFIPTAAATTFTTTTSTTTTTQTSTPTATTTTASIVTQAATTSPTSTTAAATPTTTPIPSPTATTSPILTTTSTATKTTQVVTTTTATPRTTAQSTTTASMTTISTTSASSAPSATAMNTMSATIPMTSTVTRTANTATTTSSAGTATQSATSSTPPVLEPHTSGFLRGNQPTLTDTCYFFNIWVQNHDFQSPSDVFAVSIKKTFTECVHMCTGNPECLVFVFHDNGECKVGATSTPGLWTTATMSSRVYRLVHLDTNKNFHAP